MFKNITDKRYSYINNPFGFKARERQYIHPAISSFWQFEQKQKDDLTRIKKIIIDKIGQCDVYVFGSYILGCWDEQSDYDIAVNKKPSAEQQRYLKSYDFGFKVDLFFYEQQFYNKKAVQI